MIKVLFVCHGNICRSPMAEYIMKKLVRDSGLQDEFEIASAAVSDEEHGNPIYPPALAVLREHGIPVSNHRAHRMTMQEYGYYDYVICMDRSNLSYLQRMTKGDPAHRISLLLDYTDDPRDVRDPWYTDCFDEAYADIENGCRCLLKTLVPASPSVHRP